MAVLSSPFASSGTAVRLPEKKIGCADVTIRIIGASDTDSVYISTKPDVIASATQAEFILYSKEAIEISGEVLGSLSDISIVAGSGTPDVFWGLT